MLKSSCLRSTRRTKKYETVETITRDVDRKREREKGGEGTGDSVSLRKRAARLNFIQMFGQRRPNDPGSLTFSAEKGAWRHPFYNNGYPRRCPCRQTCRLHRIGARQQTQFRHVNRVLGGIILFIARALRRARMHPAEEGREGEGKRGKAGAAHTSNFTHRERASTRARAWCARVLIQG